jgi:hypothetical protein
MAKHGKPFTEITLENIADALDELRALVDERLPQRIYRSQRWWPGIGTAMLVRVSDIARSAAVLLRADCYQDAVITTRVMYEQAMTFCWIAASPEDRLKQWQEMERAALGKAYEEAKEYGIELLTPEQLEKARKLRVVSMWQIVRDVDDYWPEKIPGFRKPSGTTDQINILTLSGLYLGLYRVTSRVVHAQPESLDHVLAPKPSNDNIYVVDHVESKSGGMPALMVPLFAMALTVHHSVTGWPDLDAVKMINDNFAWEGSSPEA